MGVGKKLMADRKRNDRKIFLHSSLSYELSAMSYEPFR
jgi:hypothetical protein